MFKQKKYYLIVVLILLATVSSVCGAEKALLWDGWNTIEMDEKTVGFNYEQFFKDDFGYHYEVDQTVQMNFLSNIVKVNQDINLELNHDYTLKSYQVSSNTDGIITTIKATFDNGNIEVVSTGPDGKEYKSHWQVEGDFYASDSYIQSMFAQGNVKPGQKETVKCWDYATNQPKEVTVLVEEIVTFEYNGKTLPGFKIIVEDEEGKQINIVDWTGRFYLFEDINGGLEGRRVEEGQIPELESMAMDVLMVAAEKMVSHPYRTTESQVLVNWRDVNFDEFNWEDNRQKLISHNKSTDGEEVVVQITKDERDFTGKITLPVEDDHLAKYLADTDYVHPSIPEVEALVTEIVGDETDAWIVTQKLVDFVYNYIASEPIIQTLTTEEILDGKKGKCSEYAVLFASLARAAGLPTKISLGERYDSKMWVGHLWNEVWLGEWISVDPSHGQIAPDALLLKFVDSDTVMGTQIVRQGLIGKLGIKIKDVTTDIEEEGQVALQTGIEGQTYTNADFRCQISGPAGWQLIETTDQGIPMLVIQTTEPAVAQGLLLLVGVPAGTTSDQILTARLGALKEQLPEFTLIDQQTGELNGYPVSYATFTINNQGTILRQQNWILIDGDSCYLFVFGTADDMWEQNEDYFQQIRESFKLVD